MLEIKIKDEQIVYDCRFCDKYRFANDSLYICTDRDGEWLNQLDIYEKKIDCHSFHLDLHTLESVNLYLKNNTK